MTTGTRTLRRSMRAHGGRILAAAALFVGYQAGEALVPVLIGVIIDRATAAGDAPSLLLWLGVLMADFAFLSLCWRSGMRVALFAGVRADRAFRLAVTERLLDDRGTAGASDLPAGALVSIATADVRRMTMVNFLLPHGVAAMVGAVVAGAALVIVSVPLGLLVLVGTPVLLAAARWLAVPLERRAEQQQDRAAHAAGVAVDLIRGIRVLKGLGVETAGRARYRDVSRASLAATLPTTRAEAGHTSALTALTGLFLALVALVGGRLAAKGEITIGELVSAVGLAQFLLTPLTTFGEIIAALAAGRASAARVGALLDDEGRMLDAAGRVPDPAGEGDSRVPAGDGDGDLPAPRPAREKIVLSGVRGPGLDGVDLTVAAGGLVCVVTTDPAAATTLVRCLAGEAEPEAGHILLDGTPLGALAPAAVRRTMLVPPHDGNLFEGSLRENIAAGRPGDVTRAARAARADQVAAALPGGLDGAVAERGRSLSGGQRQRVALARALHADPPVLVLHEPTTAVDTVTELEIAAGLRELRAGRTTLIVTSSPALLTAADRVVLVENGRVTATGAHDVLARSSAGYREAVLA
ncbi:ABC transporter ATP-binding protein [Frankia sp. R43]|uniref:ABC transporter ATP-binding protein n=1 Tax=Frankia sp. R43 TaxID=269536 RepID=UPI001F2169A5|nr:ABC transporter ATP-binding protein [Frankia sp. R43]